MRKGPIYDEVCALVCAAELDAASQLYDLGLSCLCMQGDLCCLQCAYNMRFRGGTKYCSQLSDLELVDVVLSGEKPVGTIPSKQPNPMLANHLRNQGLEVLVDGARNRWGMHEYVFARAHVADFTFGQRANLQAVENACGVRLPADMTIRQHAQSDAFLNETDKFIERGIMYGYPLWSSIALQVIRDKSLKQ